MEQVAGKVDLVPHLQGPHRPNLELPLPWHHLSIDARDDQSRLHTTRYTASHHGHHALEADRAGLEGARAATAMCQAGRRRVG